MDLLAHLRRLVAWTIWADRVSLASMRAAGTPPAATVRWLAHVAGAERMWLSRIAGAAPPLAVWPELTLDECAAQLETSAGEWRAFLDGLDAGGLERAVSYRNTRGETFTNTVTDVITQVVAHGEHHRGQIAAALRAAGHEPALTDYVHAVRTGALA